MQSFSTSCSKAASLTVVNRDSDTVTSSYVWRRTRRKERWDLGGCSSVGSHSSPRFLFPKFSSRKPCFHEAKRGSFGRSFALALPLEHEPAGSDKWERREVLVGSMVGCRSNDRVDDNEGEVEEVVDFEQGGQKVTALVDKGRTDVRSLAERLSDAKTADDVEELFKSVDDLPLPVYSTIIKGFGLNKRLDAAFALLEWLKRKKEDEGSWLEPNLFIYNSILGAVKQSGRFELVDEVMADMNYQAIAPNIVTYNALMSIYIEQGRPDEALGILGDIERSGLSPSPSTYSTVLRAYRKMDDASGAIEFFVKFREEYEKGEIESKDTDWENEFVKIEAFTIRICYLVMRQSLVKEDDPTTSIFNILSDMDTSKLNPGRLDYERLVWACTVESHYIVARELYRRIREIDNAISLSVCNHIIWLLGKAKKWWAALEIYEDLLDKGPKPNSLSHELIISHFNFLLTAARRKGIWKWGVRLLNKMLDKGLRPGPREWNAVLVACSKASETSAAVQIFRRMVEQGEKPTVLSYGALLSALEKGQLYDEALKVWDHMTKVGLKPNLHAYTILVSVYAGQGRPEMVDYVLREMVSSGIEPSVVTFNAIITGCARNQMGSTAFEWFHRMKVRNIKPNEITYDMLIKTLTHDGKPRLAYDMYLRACIEGLNLSFRSYDAVIESCQTYGASIDVDALGPRPLEKKQTVRIQEKLSEVCDPAGVPRRGKPFDRSEIYASQVQER